MMKLLSLAVVALVSVATAEHVSVELYYEALCEGCQDMITDGVGDIVDDPCFNEVAWTFVPYGNAVQKKHGDQTVTECEFGELECKRNKEELCALKYLSAKKVDEDAIAIMLICMESYIDADYDTVGKCFQKHHPELVQSVTTCSKSSEGDKLVDAAAKKTNAVPNREYVPWLMINGEHAKEQDGLKNQICKASKNTVCCDNSWKNALRRVDNLFGYFPQSWLKGKTLETCPVEQADVASQK